MGHKQSPALIVAALLLLTPLAYGQIVPIVGTGLFRGLLCCTPTGNCASGSPRLPGVTVNLNCTNLLTGVQTLGQGVTNSVGVFNIILPIYPVRLPITSVLTCNAVVNLPLNSTVCPILSTVNGILTGVPTLVNTLFNALLGPIFVLVFEVLSIVTITT